MGLNNAFKNLLNSAEKAFKHLYQQQKYKPADLATEKAYQNLLNDTYNIFEPVIKDNVTSAYLQNKLKNDVFLFSGLKTHAQLTEAAQLLMDNKGKIKPYEQFKQAFNQINKNYNQTYLEAEYQYAIGATQMADQWQKFSDDESRYYLQYRTAGDDRVRDTHEPLHNTTLPKSDPFWDSYYPPNGWRCRCSVVEVNAFRYEKSNSQEAITKGEKATTSLDKKGNNRLEIFRYNPGKKQVIFPPKHPYNKIAGAKEVSKIFNDKKEINRLRKEKDKELNEWAAKKIKKGQHLSITGKQFKTPEVRISRSNIENVLKHIADTENKNIVKELDKILKTSKYHASKELENKDPKNYGAKVARGVLSYNYYTSEWNGKRIEINMEVMKNGYEQPYAILFDKK